MDHEGAVGFLTSPRNPEFENIQVTWKPKKGSIKTTVLLKGDYMGLDVSLGECSYFHSMCTLWLYTPPQPLALNAGPVLPNPKRTPPRGGHYLEGQGELITHMGGCQNYDPFLVT